MTMTRCLSVAVPACLAVVGLCGCVFVAKPDPTTQSGEQGERPVYVVVQGPEDSPPNVRTTHEGANDKPAHAPPPVLRGKFKYRYYPLTKVYFAPDRGRYYWLSPRGWRVGTRLPKSITIEGEAAVTVELNTDVPYTQHAKVERAHPGRGKARGKANR
jgi:hypothetical protein